MINLEGWKFWVAVFATSLGLFIALTFLSIFFYVGVSVLSGGFI